LIPHIHRRTFGSGQTPVLAIHCSLAHSGAWRAIGTVLRDEITLHAFDLPCHGKSGDWDGQGVMHDTATDMALAVLDGIGRDTVDIVGHSFGATVALRLAIEHPGRVRSVAMFEPVYLAPAIADDPELGAHYARDIARFDAALDTGDRDGAARAFNAVWGNKAEWQDIPAPIRTYMADRVGFVRHSSPFLIDDCAGLLRPGRFGAANMPALLLRGGSSAWAKAVNGAIARRLPDARDVALAQTGHMGPVTHPEPVAAELRAFWAACP